MQWGLFSTANRKSADILNSSTVLIHSYPNRFQQTPQTEEQSQGCEQEQSAPRQQVSQGK